MAHNRLRAAWWLYWLVISALFAVLTLSAMRAPLTHAAAVTESMTEDDDPLVG